MYKERLHYCLPYYFGSFWFHFLQFYYLSVPFLPETTGNYTYNPVAKLTTAAIFALPSVPQSVGLLTTSALFA